MVGYDNRSEKLTSIDFVTAGALSSFITRALCQPFDVLKIRFQLQVEPIKKKVSSKYQSLPQALFVIYKDEGIKAFWKGHVPAQYLSVTYGLTQFYLFEILTKQIDIIHLHKTRKALGNFICGAIAGIVVVHKKVLETIVLFKEVQQQSLHFLLMWYALD